MPKNAGKHRPGRFSVLAIVRDRGEAHGGHLRDAGIPHGTSVATLLTLERQGYLASRQSPTANPGTRVRLYRLTRAGELLLAAEEARLADRAARRRPESAGKHGVI
jgi:DNA-binding PadR family transcriptional regulator